MSAEAGDSRSAGSSSLAPSSASEAPDESSLERAVDAEALDRLVGAVRRASGVDFAHYKRTVLSRKLLELAADEGATSLSAYAARLEHDREAAAKVGLALLNNTTAMFRDPASFDLLRTAALPELVARRSSEGATALRAWVAACSTGEEAYSIAMCLVDEVERQGTPLDSSVVASDVDAAALAQAEAGLVDEERARLVPATFAERWLLGTSGARHFAPSLRERVRFARHDVVSSAMPAPAEAAFASFDLVSCRNLLIYLEPASQERVMLRLLKACAPGSLLLLGETEWAPEPFADQLEPVGNGVSLYWVP